MSFEEYFWNLYLPKHKHPLTKLLHFFGLGLTWTCIVLFLMTLQWWYLPLAWCIVYPFAWTAHLLIEKNKPAAFKSPIRAKMADHVMLWLVINGLIPLDTRD